MSTDTPDAKTVQDVQDQSTPPRTIELMEHQKMAVRFVMDHPFCALFLGMGFGKTLATLSALYLIRPNGHILVTAPAAIARSVWADEIEDWGLPFRTKSLVVNERGNTLSRKARLKRYEEVLTDPPTMYFINIDLLHDLVDYMESRSTRGTVDAWPFPTLVIDESQRIKNPTSRRTKSALKIRPYLLRVIELTGTPAPQGLLDLYSQIYLLDGGLALGKNMETYKATYFDVDKIIDGRPVKWTTKPGMAPVIYDRIKHLAMSALNTDLKLPPMAIKTFRVHLSDDEMEQYTTLAKEAVIDLVGEDGDLTRITGVNAGALHQKLLQFASGAVYVPPSQCSICHGDVEGSVELVRKDIGEHIDVEKDTALGTVTLTNSDFDHHAKVTKSSPDCCTICGAPAYIVERMVPTMIHHHVDPDNDDHDAKIMSQHESYRVIHDKKIQMLKYILGNEDSPVIVVYKNIADRTEIAKMLADEGLRYKIFDGKSSTVKSWNNREYDVMLVHPASGGPGLNLQYGGKTIVWYTLGSAEQFQQMNKRLHRPGQQEMVSIFVLLTEGTADMRQPGRLAKNIKTEGDLIVAMRREAADILGES